MKAIVREWKRKGKKEKIKGRGIHGRNEKEGIGIKEEGRKRMRRESEEKKMENRKRKLTEMNKKKDRKKSRKREGKWSEGKEMER